MCMYVYIYIYMCIGVCTVKCVSVVRFRLLSYWSFSKVHLNSAPYRSKNALYNSKADVFEANTRRGKSK